MDRLHAVVAAEGGGGAGVAVQEERRGRFRGGGARRGARLREGVELRRELDPDAAPAGEGGGGGGAADAAERVEDRLAGQGEELDELPRQRLGELGGVEALGAGAGRGVA